MRAALQAVQWRSRPHLGTVFDTRRRRHGSKVPFGATGRDLSFELIRSSSSGPEPSPTLSRCRRYLVIMMRTAVRLHPAGFPCFAASIGQVGSPGSQGPYGPACSSPALVTCQPHPRACLVHKSSGQCVTALRPPPRTRYPAQLLPAVRQRCAQTALPAPHPPTRPRGECVPQPSRACCRAPCEPFHTCTH